MHSFKWVQQTDNVLCLSCINSFINTVEAIPSRLTQQSLSYSELIESDEALQSKKRLLKSHYGCVIPLGICVNACIHLNNPTVSLLLLSDLYTWGCAFKKHFFSPSHTHLKNSLIHVTLICHQSRFHVVSQIKIAIFMQWLSSALPLVYYWKKISEDSEMLKLYFNILFVSDSKVIS